MEKVVKMSCVEIVVCISVLDCHFGRHLCPLPQKERKVLTKNSTSRFVIQQVDEARIKPPWHRKAVVDGGGLSALPGGKVDVVGN